MTVVAGITDGITTWIAADSGACDDGGLFWPANDKVIRLLAGSDTVLLAFSGSGALKGAMRDHLTLTAPKSRDLDAWSRYAAQQISDVALDMRPPVVDEHGTLDGVALLGCRGGLWRIASTTAIPVPRSCAIGSGGDIAHGVLRALAAETALSDEQMVVRAVEIACQEQSDCMLPMTVECAA